MESQVAPSISKIEANVTQSFQAAISDVFAGIKSWRIWLMLGWQDIQHRYRRSALGPIWITLSMAIMTLSLGVIYSGLLKIEVQTFLPYVGAGLIVWNFLSVTVMEMVDTFVEAQHYIKQIQLPFTVYVLRIQVRNYIVCAHNLVVLIFLQFYLKIHFDLPMFLVGFMVISIAMFSFGFLLSMFGARFRDTKPIIQNILQLLFYVTPIMWMPEMLPNRLLLAMRINPMYHLVEIIRAPLLGKAPSHTSLLFSLIVTAIGVFTMLFLYTRSRHKIAFWV